MTKNILFITWDGPQTNYVEGLFMPIFQQVEKECPLYKFHYLQFTWAKDTMDQIEASVKYNIPYASSPISRQPIASIGSLITLLSGHKKIKKYIDSWKIDILMPRSTFPFYMVNKLKTNLPILFDADGLPIEERIDFANLKRGGYMHKVLKSIEGNALKKSNHIITRSYKSIAYHKSKDGHNINHDRFSVVTNGRDINKFQPNSDIRKNKREELEINKETFVFVYAGSFGPQYGWNEMLDIFQKYISVNHDCHFLFLTGSPELVIPLIPNELLDKFTVKRVPFHEVSKYLNVADLAFAIRKPLFSMQGVAPIKLGEYLLMDLPTIASEGIGDTTDILKNIPGTFLYNHDRENSTNEVLEFIDNIQNVPNGEIRMHAKKHFSLHTSALSYCSALGKLNI